MLKLILRDSLDFVQMSGNLTVVFDKSVAGYAEENGREYADHRMKADGKTTGLGG